MSSPVSAKTVLVTGGARRLGRAICLSLSRAGARLVIHAHTSVKQAEGLRAEIESAGGEARVVTGDLARSGGAEEVYRDATEAGPVHWLVNNAAVYPTCTLRDLTAEVLDHCHRVNVVAPAILTRLLAESGSGEAVVNLLDARMLDYDALHVPYQLSKRGLLTLTRLAALEYAPRLRVNAVAPGLVLPPEGRDASFLERHARSNPLQSWGSAEAVADAVLFLLMAEFVTGQVVYVDGGRHLRGCLYG